MADRFSDGARVSRAKVWVSEVSNKRQGRPGHPDDVSYQVEDVTFTFVNGNDPDSENAKFWDASPTAQPFHLVIANKALFGTFKPGMEFYMDFTEAVRTPADA